MPTTTKKHPLYVEMIKAAIAATESKKGASKGAIVKYVTKTYDVGDNEKNILQIIKMTIKRNVESGTFVQATGHGASGSFKLPTKKAGVKKPSAKKVAKKPAAKKAKKPATKAAPAKKKATPQKKKKVAPKKKAAAKKSKK